MTSDGKIIAATNTSDGNEKRVYPYSEMFSHAVGYVDEGMASLEAQYSFDLLKSHVNLSDQIENELSGSKNLGDNLYTTLDFDTQKAAYDGLGSYKGAVIAIEPDTGKVIAMVSKPDFDPNTLADYWDFITADDNDSSILLNRATQGKYPPGSTFKIVTTLAYLRDNDMNEDFDFLCKGTFDVGEDTIHCSSNEKHGNEDLEEAFYNSCNSAYASIGVDLDRKVFKNTAESLLFNTDLPTMLGSSRNSRFKLTSASEDILAAQTAIGQGETSVSPLHMCMLASSIANDGKLMEPYIADKIVSADNFLVSQTEPVEYAQIMTKDEAALLKKYMRAVVTDGTADGVDFGDLKVYGKTGSAEYSSDKDSTHSWFIGFAENSKGKQLAVAVIMEGAGYGSKYAAPLAADVFDAYFD